ncbi:MAG: YncE family protein [Candidatus Aureabacteria bacterium]|nr:YncE family protein [Candidatus Auribacterota bacterium]
MRTTIVIAISCAVMCPLAAHAEEVVYVVNGYIHNAVQPEWSTVMMLRGSNLEIMATLELPAKDGHSVAITPDLSELWVTASNGYSAFVIDTKTFQIIHQYDYNPSGVRPMGVAVSPGGLEALIGLRDFDTVMRYNTETFGALHPGVDAGIEPAFLIFTPDGTRVCVVDLSTPQVRVYRTSDYVPQRTYTFETGGLGEAAVSPDGNILYVCNMAHDQVERVMLNPPWIALGALSTGPYINPRGIAISPDGNYLFIGHYMGINSKVTMWRLNPTWALCAVADIPANGRRVVTNPDCTRIYVTEHSEDQCCAYRVNLVEESMFLDAVADLDTISGLRASPIGIAVGDYATPTPTSTPTPTPLPVFVPFNLRLESSVLPTTGTLVLKADVMVEGTAYGGVPILPYIMVDVGGLPYFILSGNKVTTKMTPYMKAGKKKKNMYFKLYSNIMDLELARINFVDLPRGQYPVLGGFLDSHGRLVGQIAERTLTIE